MADKPAAPVSKKSLHLAARILQFREEATFYSNEAKVATNADYKEEAEARVEVANAILKTLEALSK